MTTKKWEETYLELIDDCMHYISIQDLDRVKLTMQLMDKMLEVRPMPDMVTMGSKPMALLEKLKDNLKDNRV